MKRILMSVVGAVLLMQLSAAQTAKEEFENFRSGASAQMQSFRKDIDIEFADALAKQWAEFRTFSPVQRRLEPKPYKAPRVPKRVIPISGKLPLAASHFPVAVNTSELASPVSIAEFARPDNAADAPANAMLGTLGFDFYDSRFLCAPNVLLTRIPALGNIDEPSVAAFWRQLDTSRGTDGLTLADGMRLCLQRVDVIDEWNDWSLFRFVSKLSEHWWHNPSEQVVVQTFLLNQLGFDVKVGRVGDDRLCLLFCSGQKVYERQYINVRGQKYYILDREKVASVRTYTTKDDGGGARPLRAPELALIRSDRAFRMTVPDTVRKTMPTLGLTLVLPVRKSRTDFYADCLQLDVENYLHENVDADFRTALLNQLDTLTRLDTLDAVNRLLQALQYDFAYATDQDQFGYEKPFFVAENFIYDFNDCEDRAVLFAFIARNLLGLDTVLLDYPDHVAAAVNFSANIPGAYYEQDEKRYYVCDPTYIGAKAGMVMPKYRDIPAKLLR